MMSWKYTHVVLQTKKHSQRTPTIDCTHIEYRPRSTRSALESNHTFDKCLDELEQAVAVIMTIMRIMAMIR